MRSSGEVTQALPEDPAVLRALLGCVPTRGVAAVGKWPAGATAKSRAQAGHLSTAGVAREGVATADLRLWFEMQPLNPEHGDDDDQRQDGAAGADREERRYRPDPRDAGLRRRTHDGSRGTCLHWRGARGAGSGQGGTAQRLSRAGLGDASGPDRAADPPPAPG